MSFVMNGIFNKYGGWQMGLIETCQKFYEKYNRYPNFIRMKEKTMDALFDENEVNEFTRIGGWWDRKGENEIDVIAVNDFENTCDVYEGKRQTKNINLTKLSEKVNNFKSNVKSEIGGYIFLTFGLSMEDM